MEIGGNGVSVRGKKKTAAREGGVQIITCDLLDDVSFLSQNERLSRGLRKSVSSFGKNGHPTLLIEIRRDYRF